MTLPSPRITPYVKGAFDPASGIHCFPFWDDAGNGLLLFKDNVAPRVLRVVGSGWSARSAAFFGNSLFLVSSAGGHYKQGPWMVSEWDLTGWESKEELRQKSPPFIFGVTDTQNVTLVQCLGARPVCVAFRKARPDINLEYAFFNPSASRWESRFESYGPISEGSNVDAFSFGAIQGTDGAVNVLVKQDGGMWCPMFRFRLTDGGLELASLNQTFLNSHYGSLAPNGELPQFDVTLDGDDILFGYVSGYLGPICGMNSGEPLIIRVTPDQKLSAVVKIPDSPAQVYWPGVPVFPTLTDIWFLTCSWNGSCGRDWVLWRKPRLTGVAVRERVIQISEPTDPSTFSYSPDGWVFYKPLGSAVCVLEKLFTDAVPTPVPVPVPVPTPTPVPVPTPSGLTITTDKPEYQSRETIVIRFRSAPETVINGLVEPSNSKQPNVERRNTSIEAETDETGLLVARVVIKPSWKGPIKIEAEATKDAYSIGKSTIYVPLV